MQGLKQCKIAQGSEIANEQQQGAVGGAFGEGGETLLPVFQRQIIYGRLSLYSKHLCRCLKRWGTIKCMSTSLCTIGRVSYRGSVETIWG